MSAYDALFGFNPRLDNCSQNKNSTSLITTKEVVINVLQHGEQLAHILGKANGTCVCMCLYVFVYVDLSLIVEIAPIFNYIEYIFIDCVGSISSITLAAFQLDVVYVRDRG